MASLAAPRFSTALISFRGSSLQLEPAIAATPRCGDGAKIDINACAMIKTRLIGLLGAWPDSFVPEPPNLSPFGALSAPQSEGGKIISRFCKFNDIQTNRLLPLALLALLQPPVDLLAAHICVRALTSRGKSTVADAFAEVSINVVSLPKTPRYINPPSSENKLEQNGTGQNRHNTHSCERVRACVCVIGWCRFSNQVQNLCSLMEIRC